MFLQKEEFKLWLETLMQRNNLNPVDIEKKTGLAASTVYKWLDLSSKSMPTLKSIEKLKPAFPYNSFDILIPDTSKEKKLEDVVDCPPVEGIVCNEMQFFKQINNDKLKLTGWLDGDVIQFSTELSPKVGSLILIEAHTRKMLGFFQPPYFIHGTLEVAPETTPIYLDGKHAKIIGVFEKMFRFL